MYGKFYSKLTEVCTFPLLGRVNVFLFPPTAEKNKKLQHKLQHEYFIMFTSYRMRVVTAVNPKQ